MTILEFCFHPFFGENNKYVSIMVVVQEDLTFEQQQTIEDALNSYVDSEVLRDPLESVVETVMNSFPFEWKIVPNVRKYYI